MQRTAARVVLVDDGGAVFLISAIDPGVPGSSEFWFTPGGGSEPGETLEQAAMRELHEETGRRLDRLGPIVWERSATFSFDGGSYEQEESFFVVRTARFEPRPVALTDYEERSTTGWRWWALSDLAESGVTLYPPDLAPLVAEWLREGHRGAPRRID